MRGQLFSSDSRTRWRSTLRAARGLGLEVTPELIIRLEKDTQSPELGYPGVASLLSRRRDFTALLCFNDISAIGAIRAIHDAGLRVPTDISVMGFDDIPAAEFYTPSLTTIRQPLRHMGSVAAEQLLKRIGGGKSPETTHIEPELIVRESTAIVRSSELKPQTRRGPLSSRR